MADDPPRSRYLRVLLSEGASTSAREVVTVLGLAGHAVEVCDPSPYCIARFSKFVRRFHRCPGMRNDPAGFLGFVENLVKARRFDVLLPVHEQGFLFARALHRLEAHAGIALPDFESYRIAHGKASFSRLLDDLALPQPETRIVGSVEALRDAVRYPCVVKSNVGTASRGVWFVRDEMDLILAVRELDDTGAFEDEVLIQDFAAGATEKAQAVFRFGELLGFHAYRQITAGAGGGDAVKLSVLRPHVRAHLGMIGQRLSWHGALSVDYIAQGESAAPLYIDCNPRLVEPMSAYLAGVNLVDLLLRVSHGEAPPIADDSREGVRTCLAMQSLMGSALRGGTRRDIVAQCWNLLTGGGEYTGAAEELTPVRRDWISAAPLAITTVLLLLNPGLASVLAKRGWGAHLLDIESMRKIEAMPTSVESRSDGGHKSSSS